MKRSKIDAETKRAPFGDPVFAALEAHLDANRSYACALDAWNKVVESSCGRLTPAQIHWEVYKLQDLEATVTKTEKTARQAKSTALATKPNSIEGCAALLRLTRELLSDYRTLTRVTKTIANVEAALIRVTV